MATKETTEATQTPKRFDPEELVRAHLLLEEWKIRRQLQISTPAAVVAVAPTLPQAGKRRDGLTRPAAAKLLGCSPTQFDRYRNHKLYRELLRPAFNVGSHPRWTKHQIERLKAILKKDEHGDRE